MKKIIKIILAGLFVLGLGSNIFASGLDNKNAIGMYIIGANDPIGGIQYERALSDVVSEKVGIFAFYNNDDYSEPYRFSVSSETDFKLFETTWKEKVSSKLFAYGLFGYKCFGEREYIYPNKTAYDDPIDVNDTFYQNIFAGLGFGFDFIFFDHLSVPIQFGFIGEFPYNLNIGFSAGVSIRYTW